VLGLFAKLLPLDSTAPDFALRDEDGAIVRLADRRGAVVLVFYPMDETPVCRRQLCEFRDQWMEFQRRDIAVWGVNPGSADSHGKFRRNHRFPFPLLIDEGQKVARLYRANGLVVRRTVYGIDPHGRIVFAERGKPEPARVLGAL